MRAHEVEIGKVYSRKSASSWTSFPQVKVLEKIGREFRVVQADGRELRVMPGELTEGFGSMEDNIKAFEDLEWSYRKRGQLLAGFARNGIVAHAVTRDRVQYIQVDLPWDLAEQILGDMGWLDQEGEA